MAWCWAAGMAFGFGGIMQEGCEQGVCCFCVISGVGATSRIGLSVAPQGPSLCLGWTTKEKLGIMGVLAQAGWGYPVLLLAAARGTGSPCVHLESGQLVVEGVAVQRPALLLGPREGGHNGESRVLVTLWGWAAQAEQEEFWEVFPAVPPLTPILSVPTELLY